MHLGLALTFLAGLAAAVPTPQFQQVGQTWGQTGQRQTWNRLPGFRNFQQGTVIQPNTSQMPQCQVNTVSPRVATARQGVVYSRAQIDQLGDYFACTSMGMRLVYHNLYSIPVASCAMVQQLTQGSGIGGGLGGVGMCNGIGGGIGTFRQPNYIWVCGSWYTFEFLWINGRHQLFYNPASRIGGGGINTGIGGVGGVGQRQTIPWTATCNGFGLGLNPLVNTGGVINPIVNNNIRFTPGVGILGTVRTACLGVNNLGGIGGVGTGINQGQFGGIGNNAICTNGRINPLANIPNGTLVSKNEVPRRCLGAQLVLPFRDMLQRVLTSAFPLRRMAGNSNFKFGWVDSQGNSVTECGYLDD